MIDSEGNNLSTLFSFEEECEITGFLDFFRNNARKLYLLDMEYYFAHQNHNGRSFQSELLQNDLSPEELLDFV